MEKLCVIFCSLVGARLAAADATENLDLSPSAKVRLGHSAHGEAFDSGPQQKPWVMVGIGRAPFPITKKNSEVQPWFDPGDTLLRKKQWEPLAPVVRAVSSAKVDPDAASIQAPDGVAVRWLADRGQGNARRFRSYDDFEDSERHSTTLADKQGRAYWACCGGDKLTDLTLLEKQLKRRDIAWRRCSRCRRGRYKNSSGSAEW